MCLRAGLTWVRVRFIFPFAVSALKHGCSEALPTSQLIPTVRVSAAWAAARDRQCGRRGKCRGLHAMMGETAAGPFIGHTNWVMSVAFSPDGQHIASGSNDGTIRVWNAIMGETAAGPFTGHTNQVSSVAFSPDGHHIVSGSKDRTIRVWNAMMGETVTDSFTGVTGLVTSVAFSPDGQYKSFQFHTHEKE